MFLNQEQIRELTGFIFPKKQAKYLAARGYSFELRADGKISILQKHVEEKLGIKNAKISTLEPDFEALELLIRTKNGKKKKK